MGNIVAAHTPRFAAAILVIQIIFYPNPVILKSCLQQLSLERSFRIEWKKIYPCHMLSKHSFCSCYTRPHYGELCSDLSEISSCRRARSYTDTGLATLPLAIIIQFAYLDELQFQFSWHVFSRQAVETNENVS